jgi:hypothetical protein
MAMTQTQSPWTYASLVEFPLARGLNSSGSESSIDSGFESPLGGGKDCGSPVNRALNNMLSRLSISSAPSDIDRGVVGAGCCGNSAISPTHLSPGLDCKLFAGGLLGSDGESDPFDSSSPPAADHAHEFFQQPWQQPSAYPPPPPSHVFPLGPLGGNFGLGVYETASLLPPGDRTYYPKNTACRFGTGGPFGNNSDVIWSGQLPARRHKNPTYSPRVFLGGVPWDITETALLATFQACGNLTIDWPGKENKHNRHPPKGYVYLTFDSEKSVKNLLMNCLHDPMDTSQYYYKVCSRRVRNKEVQVIPWALSDSNSIRCPSPRLDPSRTVFVGGLHGLLNAGRAPSLPECHSFSSTVYCISEGFAGENLCAMLLSSDVFLVRGRVERPLPWVIHKFTPWNVSFCQFAKVTPAELSCYTYISLFV